ncbi:MAG: diacylglycerol/polyprenol kinase family protein [Planctomycetota bacterium]
MSDGAIHYRHELRRKAIHLCSALSPLVYLQISRELMLWLIVPLMVAFVLLDILRLTHSGFRKLYDRWLGPIMRRDEGDRLCGASYVMIAAVVCVFLFDKPVAVAALLFMSVSDALASLVGRSVGGPRWFDKTLAGSAAFFCSALLIGWWCLPGHQAAAVAGALVATIVEAVAGQFRFLRVDDNLLIPLAGGVVMTALHHYP